jgi:hypothetical protein
MAPHHKQFFLLLVLLTLLAHIIPGTSHPHTPVFRVLGSDSLAVTLGQVSCTLYVGAACSSTDIVASADLQTVQVLLQTQYTANALFGARYGLRPLPSHVAVAKFCDD